MEISCFDLEQMSQKATKLLWHVFLFHFCFSGGQRGRWQSVRRGRRRPHGSRQQDFTPQHPPALLQPPCIPRALLRLSLQTQPQRHQPGRLGAAHRRYTKAFWQKNTDSAPRITVTWVISCLLTDSSLDQSELVAELLKELSNHNERIEERKAALCELLKLIRENTLQVWDEHFKTILLLLLETMGDREVHTYSLAHTSSL